MQTFDLTDDLTLDEYQCRSRATAHYPRVQISLDGGPLVDAPYLYPLLGLLGEAGEIAEKFKKLVRDDKGLMTSTRALATKAELGDVQWYLARLADSLQTTLGEVAEQNLEKLESRKTRGVLGGDGDQR